MKTSVEILDILRTHKNELFDRFGVLDIAVFGSYSRNEQNNKSDIDVFVELKDGFITFDNFIELKFFIEDLTLKKIDLVVKDSIRKEFKESILIEAVYL